MLTINVKNTDLSEEKENSLITSSNFVKNLENLKNQIANNITILSLNVDIFNDLLKVQKKERQVVAFHHENMT